jgi:hypothetical protein
LFETHPFSSVITRVMTNLKTGLIYPFYPKKRKRGLTHPFLWNENPLILIKTLKFKVFKQMIYLKYYQVLEMLNPMAKSPSKKSY